MRRREAGLGYWLAAGPDPEQVTLWARIGRTVLWQRKAGRLKCDASELPLGMEVTVLSPEAFVSSKISVWDGIGNLAVASNCKGGTGHAGNVEELNVRSIGPLPPAASKNIVLPGDLPIRPKGQELICSPAVRSMQRNSLESKARLRSVACYHELGPPLSCSQWLTPTRIIVRTGTSGIAGLPQASRTLDLNEMREAEREGFLREAAALRGVPPGRGELLAVFRNVPIEVVSRLSFSKESRTIRYSVILSPSLRRTRVHDLAAVRDVSTEEIHLVPHRTRYRTVFLN